MYDTTYMLGRCEDLVLKSIHATCFVLLYKDHLVLMIPLVMTTTNKIKDSTFI